MQSFRERVNILKKHFKSDCCDYSGDDDDAATEAER